MYSIIQLEDINIQNISEKQVRYIFYELLRDNQIEEIKYFVKMPGVKEKININQDSFFMQLCLHENCEIIEYILFSNDFKPENEMLSDKDKTFSFGSFCKAGDINRAKLVYDNFSINQDGLNNALQLACIFGKLESVKFLLNGKAIHEKADIHYDSETALNNACREGHLEIVKYLIESPEIEEHANLHLELHGGKDYPFVLASEYSRDDIVKYLMKVEGKNKPSMSSSDYSVLKQYVLSGNLPMIKHIIEEESIDIHLDNDYLFNAATKREHYDIVQYFLIEKDIKITENIVKNLQENPNQIIEEMIKKRDLHKKIQGKYLEEIGSRKILHVKKI